MPAQWRSPPCTQPGLPHQGSQVSPPHLSPGPWAALTLPLNPPNPQNNKLEKIPPGAFSELSNLRELYLQNNHLSDEGLDNETFWWAAAPGPFTSSLLPCASPPPRSTPPRPAATSPAMSPAPGEQGCVSGALRSRTSVRYGSGPPWFHSAVLAWGQEADSMLGEPQSFSLGDEEGSLFRWGSFARPRLILQETLSVNHRPGTSQPP